ncbi:MAG: flavin reductase family protein [Acidobacteriia bacterium]|nr:flavin reductase family protein [Terriglobia bacterium]
MSLEEAKQAVYSFTYGVYLVTTQMAEERSGMTAVWVSQISKDPIHVILGLTPDSATTQLLLRSGIFAINVLAPEHKDLAYAMGRVTSKEADKFIGLSTHSRVTGAPILSDAIAYLDCKLVSHSVVGSHLVMVGEVVDGAVLREVNPAVYRNGKIF